MLLDELEQAAGPAGPVPSSDGWELVLARLRPARAQDLRSVAVFCSMLSVQR